MYLSYIHPALDQLPCMTPMGVRTYLRKQSVHNITHSVTVIGKSYFQAGSSQASQVQQSQNLSPVG